MALYFAREEVINEWLKALSDKFLVFLPKEVDKTEGKKTVFSLLKKGERVGLETFRRIRSFNPLKEFFFLAEEEVATYFKEDTGARLGLVSKPRLLFGAKSCDVRPFVVHQSMFLLKDFSDPFYKERFLRTIVITADCPVPEKTCFCNLMELTPYGEKGVDGNISVFEEGIMFETFTEKGEELVKGFAWEKAGDGYLERRKKNREEAERLLREINPNLLPDNLPERIDKRKERDFWEEKKNCVECFGCLYVCPTCFCFLLYDFAAKEVFKRMKVWDTCYMASYARVAGGLNARPLFYQRFRNRFHCKFMNAYYDFNFFSCSGCGRCYNVCPARIDIREILLAV